MADVKPEELAVHVLEILAEWLPGYVAITNQAVVDNVQHRITRTQVDHYLVEERGGYDESPQLFRVQIVIEEIS